MLAIRLQRTGRKHEPTFRVVLTDSKNGPKSGKYLENLGWYDTRQKNKLEQLNIERIKHWLSLGAKTSVTLHNFLVSQKAITGAKLNALPKKSPIKGEAPAGAATVAAASVPASTPETAVSAPVPEPVATPEAAPSPTVEPAPSQEDEAPMTPVV